MPYLISHLERGRKLLRYHFAGTQQMSVMLAHKTCVIFALSQAAVNLGDGTVSCDILQLYNMRRAVAPVIYISRKGEPRINGAVHFSRYK